MGDYCSICPELSDIYQTHWANVGAATGRVVCVCVNDDVVAHYAWHTSQHTCKFNFVAINHVWLTHHMMHWCMCTRLPPRFLCGGPVVPPQRGKPMPAECPCPGGRRGALLWNNILRSVDYWCGRDVLVEAPPHVARQWHRVGWPEWGVQSVGTYLMQGEGQM